MTELEVFDHFVDVSDDSYDHRVPNRVLSSSDTAIDFSEANCIIRSKDNEKPGFNVLIYFLTQEIRESRTVFYPLINFKGSDFSEAH